MSAAATINDVLSGAARCCVVEGDAAEVTRSVPDGRFDALVTDPPSGIAFMGAEWDRDKGGRAQWVAWLAGILADARRATRDGGRSLVWSLPRTSHWTGCAVEDAGWSIETTIAHLFGTGWPKAKAQTKPAQETWWLSRNGRSEPLNIDACRVGAESTRRAQRGTSSAWEGGSFAGERINGSEAGRYPPNLVLSHAPGCVCEGTREVERSIILPIERTTTGNPAVNAYGDGCTGSKYGGRTTEAVEAWRCVEGCPVAELDSRTGELGRAGNLGGTPRIHRGFDSKGAEQVSEMPAAYADATAFPSRFFPQFPADDPDAPWNEALFIYAPKPSRAERGEGNNHPTVKSVALMRWLIRLVTKPGDVVLDPFGGSGTTGVAALLEGRRVVLVEREPQYAAIARARCATALEGDRKVAKVAKARAVERPATVATAPRAQLSLFDTAGAR